MSTPSPSLRERVGDTLGALWAPTIARIAHARHARMFHPEGIVVGGRIEPIDDDPAGSAFAGPVIARWSGALWRRSERFDVLGLALRIRPPGRSLDATVAPGDQDLLFATARSPFTLALAPLTTRTHDFLANAYYGVAPFAMPPDGRIKLRVTPVDRAGADAAARDGDADGARASRLEAAVTDGRADLWLELRPTFMLGYRRVARVFLDRRLAIDQQALRFDPFRDGRGITPVGLVQAVRRHAYAASRAGSR
jgi:hypothetical protein